MFDILVFTQHPFAYAPKRFKKEAESQGDTLLTMSYRRLLSQGDTLWSNLPEAKYVILREPDPKPELYKLRDEILKHYLSNGAKVLNSKSYLKWSVLDKKTQHLEFKKWKIPHIKVEDYRKLNFPYIAKAILGSHGDHVYKVENENDLKNVISKYGKDNLIFQEFQKSGFDLRVIVINSKVVGIMKRTPKSGEFKSNFSQGGRIQEYRSKNDELRIKTIALQTAEHFRLDYVGVDIMLGNPPKGETGVGGWKVLEVNRACQFKGFEKSTGVNVAKELINFLTSRN